MKNAKRVLAALLLAALLLALTGCGKSAKKLVGKWTLDMEAMAEEMKDDAGFTGWASMDASLVLEDDHKCTMTIALWGENETMEGAWKEKDGKLLMVFSGEDPESFDWSIKKGRLILKTSSGETMAFKKK